MVMPPVAGVPPPFGNHAITGGHIGHGPSSGVESAGDCTGMLGGAERACCEAEGAITNQSWVFVGEGRGSYATSPKYNYVGQGCGNFNREVTVTYHGWKVRKCCLGLLALLLLPAMFYLLVSYVPLIYGLGSEMETTTTATIAPVFTTPLRPAEPFNCGTVGLWSLAKKNWCCHKYGKGCTVASTTRTSHPPPTTKRLPPQTPPAKRLPVPVPVPVPAPPPAPPTTSLPFDCNVDFTDCYSCLLQRWSVGKRAWCCSHARRGCPTTPPPQHPAPSTSPLPFDCAAGFANWQKGWSLAKKRWCCQHQRKGCPAMPAPQAQRASSPQDCSVAFDNWRAAWTPEKRTWCCQHEGKGCEHPVPH